MYESHFGLLRRPFLSTPDPDCFATVETIENALTGLQLCVETGQGFGILSAPAGTGKTLLCRKLVVDLRERFGTVFLAHSNFPTRRSLLQAILYELGHPYIRMAEQELRLELQSAVAEVRQEKEAVLLVVDEAHLLSNQLLEEIRTLANLDEEGTPLIRVVLSGQLLLEEKLTSPELEALNQRIACQVALEPFTRSESIDYITHRLHWAGADINNVFGTDALEIITHAADGLPRCLNQLCDHALLLAYVSDECPVEAATVREALEDLKQLPLHWNEPPPVSSPLAQLQMQAAASDADDGTIDEDRHESIDAAAYDTEYDDALAGAIEIGGAAENSPADWEAGEETGVVEIGAMDSLVSEQVEELAPEDSTAAVIEVGVVEVGADTQHAATLETALSQTDAELIDLTAIPHSASPMTPTDVIDGFEEELVVDRYALLDSGKPISGQEISSAASADRTERSTTTTSPLEQPKTRGGTDSEVLADAAHFATVTFGDDSALTRTPDQLIDEIQPMISEALNSPPPVEETSPEATPDSIADCRQETNGEGQGASADNFEDSLQYDIVQPESIDLVPEAPTAANDFSADGNSIPAPHSIEGQQPRGRYAHLFSKLRRRQRTA